jgi:hypothetical protein
MRSMASKVHCRPTAGRVLLAEQRGPDYPKGWPEKEKSTLLACFLSKTLCPEGVRSGLPVKRVLKHP